MATIQMAMATHCLMAAMVKVKIPMVKKRKIDKGRLQEYFRRKRTYAYTSKETRTATKKCVAVSLF